MNTPTRIRSPVMFSLVNVCESVALRGSAKIESRVRTSIHASERPRSLASSSLPSCVVHSDLLGAGTSSLNPHLPLPLSLSLFSDRLISLTWYKNHRVISSRPFNRRLVHFANKIVTKELTDRCDWGRGRAVLKVIETIARTQKSNRGQPSIDPTIASL